MAFSRMPAIGIVTLLLALSVLPARALTLEEYVELTAELTMVAWGCGVEVDRAFYETITSSFAEPDSKRREEIEKRIDDAMLSLEKRARQMGDSAFCAEMFDRYGPQGTKRKGLIKRRLGQPHPNHRTTAALGRRCAGA